MIILRDFEVQIPHDDWLVFYHLFVAGFDVAVGPNRGANEKLKSDVNCFFGGG